MSDGNNKDKEKRVHKPKKSKSHINPFYPSPQRCSIVMKSTGNDSQMTIVDDTNGSRDDSSRTLTIK